MNDLAGRGEKATWTTGALLTLLPVISFGLPYWLGGGSHNRLFQNPTVAYMDWTLVPRWSSSMQARTGSPQI